MNSQLNEIQTQDWENKLFSDSPRAIKEALDYYSSHTEQAVAFVEQIGKLRRYADLHAGMAAAQIEVAAIILYNQLTYVSSR